MQTDKDKIYRNMLAKRVFCDVADMDYISARTLYRNDCFDDFLVLSQQCIEKYLKGILLYNDISYTNSEHNLKKLLDKCNADIKNFTIFDDTKKFIEEINGFDELRYAIYVFGDFTAKREYLYQLDYAVMDLRRYCHSDVELAKRLSKVDEKQLIKITQKRDIKIGVLETIRKSKQKKYQKLRAHLIWNNLYFFPKNRKIKLTTGFWSKASGLTPKEETEFYNAVKDYVHLSPRVKKYFNNQKQLN